MSLFGKKRLAFNRADAMSARPEKLPVQSVRELEHGRALITVLLTAPRWARLLGAGGRIPRVFGLDGLGREVYEACDGRKRVQAIIQDFARRHQVSPAEAEASVTAFLRTLTAKGLIVMELERRQG